MTEQHDDVERDPVVVAAAGEQRQAPTSQVEAAALAESYDRMLGLASALDHAGEEMRQWAQLSGEILKDPAFVDSAPLSPETHTPAEEQLLELAGGKHGFLSRSIEFDADALVLRATVLTYRWIDELQEAAARTIGSIASRAIGYLAPEVALGGAIVSAGLIETDALDRDGVAAYLSELAESNPELMEHVTSGGGGLLDGLRMRSLLTAGVLAGDQGVEAARGGLRAAGIDAMPTGFAAALRDVGCEAVTAGTGPSPEVSTRADRPASLADLVRGLEGATDPVTIVETGEGRYVAYVRGPEGAGEGLRLVTGDHVEHIENVLEALGDVLSEGDHVMLVGAGFGGGIAAAIAARPGAAGFVVDEVLTAGAPSAHVPRLPDGVNMLSLENRADPVALLGALVNVGTGGGLTVVFDGDSADAAPDDSLYVVGARAADAAPHPELRSALDRLRRSGYLAG